MTTQDDNRTEPTATGSQSLDRHFTEPQIARIVGLRRAAVRAWRKQGLPCFRQKLGNRPPQNWRILFDREAVLTWLAQTGRRKHAVAFSRALGVQMPGAMPKTAQPASSENREVLTPEEAADFLGVKLRTLRCWRHNGLPFIMVGRRTLRFRRSQLLAWLDSRAVQTAPTFRH